MVCLMRVRLVMSRATITSYTNCNVKCNNNRITMINRIRGDCSILRTFDSVSNITLITCSKRHYLNRKWTRAALTLTLMSCHFTSQEMCPSMDSALPSVAKTFQSTSSERRRTRMTMKLLVGRRASPTLQDSYKRKKRKNNQKFMLKNIKKLKE